MSTLPVTLTVLVPKEEGGRAHATSTMRKHAKDAHFHMFRTFLYFPQQVRWSSVNRQEKFPAQKKTVFRCSLLSSLKQKMAKVCQKKLPSTVS